LKIAIFASCIIIVDPLRRNAQQYQGYLWITKSAFTGLHYSVADNAAVSYHSFIRCCLPNLRNHAKFRENSNL